MNNNMEKITKEQDDFALVRIEELLPMVDGNTSADDRKAVELTMMPDVVINYEKDYFPINKPTVATLGITPAAIKGYYIVGASGTLNLLSGSRFQSLSFV